MQKNTFPFFKKDVVNSVKKSKRESLFVSIHIAVCNEPVDSVLKTIEAAAFQVYDNFEVIVLYNNTNDEDIWRPVEDYCLSLNNVHFYNYKKVEGYKAGALNICSDLMSLDTELILTVDADYQLTPDALDLAVNCYHSSKADLLQFPQSYSNHQSNNALANEFNHYFNIYSESAGSVNKNLPTGTLTLINVCCLKKAGGWPTKSITEDAYLGVELLENNCVIGYSSQIIGAGTMPSNCEDLKVQRMRWIFGNFQTLIHTINSNKLNILSKKIIGIQLLSWLNFNGIPLLFVICTGLLAPFVSGVDIKILMLIAITTIALNNISQFLLLYSKSKPYQEAFSTWIISIANNLEGAFAWWGYAINSNRPFNRTNKFLKRTSMDFEQLTFNLLLFISGILSVIYLNRFIGISVLFIAGVRFLSRIHLKVSFQEVHNYELQKELGL